VQPIALPKPTLIAAVIGALYCGAAPLPALAAQAGPVFTVTTAGQAPKVAAGGNGQFVVSWRAPGGTLLYGTSAGYVQAYDATGTAVTAAPTEVTGNAFDSPALAMDADGDFVAVWVSGKAVTTNNSIVLGTTHAQRFDAAGDTAGRQQRVSPADQLDLPVSQTLYAGVGTSLPQVAMDSEGDFVVAWTVQRGAILCPFYCAELVGSGTTYAASYRANGSVLRWRKAIDRRAAIGPHSLPQVTGLRMLDNGDAVTLSSTSDANSPRWLESFNQSLQSTGGRVKVTFDPTSQIFASTPDAMGGLTAVLSARATDGSSTCVISHFGAQGQPLGTTAAIPTQDCDHVAIANTAGGGFAAIWTGAWTNNPPGNLLADLTAQFFNADGSANGQPFVMQAAVPPLHDIAAASGADGNLVVVWDNYSSTAIYGSAISSQ
jgi:hypothetical protein